MKAIINRRSVRDFIPGQISPEDIQELIKAAQFAPTAMNNRAVDFVVVSENSLKEALLKIVGQPQLVEAGVFIIPVTDQRKSVIPIQDLSIASSFIMLQAAEMGLATVWKDVRAEIAPQVRDMLGIPEDFRLINIIPVGFAKDKLPPHTDDEFADHKIHTNRW